MGHLWRRVGTGLWVVMAAMGVTAVALVGLLRAEATPSAGQDLLMAFAEFRPLHAHKSVLVVDVRDADSYANGRIPGAIHVPVREVEAKLASVRKASKGRLVVTYCSCPTEASSLRAARLLTSAGITAKALVGGFPRWVEAGGAIERDRGTGVDLWKTRAPRSARGVAFSIDRDPSPSSPHQQRRFSSQERPVLGL